MAENIRVYQAAKLLGITEAETIKMLGPQILKGKELNGDRGSLTVRRKAIAERNRLSLVDRDEVDALKRRLARTGKDLGEKRIHAGVVRRGETVQTPPPEPITVIVLTPETAALLSLSEYTTGAPRPARSFRVEISPPLSGLKAIHVEGAKLTPVWSRPPAAEVDLKNMLRTIVAGACELLAQKRAARPKKEPDPIGKRDAFMREEVTVKIETELSKKLRKDVSDVVSGRRGYSNVLKESIAVRAHLAKYHVGKGRKETKTVVRGPFRRGPKTGDEKARTYKVKS